MLAERWEEGLAVKAGCCTVGHTQDHSLWISWFKNKSEKIWGLEICKAPRTVLENRIFTSATTAHFYHITIFLGARKGVWVFAVWRANLSSNTLTCLYCVQQAMSSLPWPLCLVFQMTFANTLSSSRHDTVFPDTDLDTLSRAPEILEWKTKTLSSKDHWKLVLHFLTNLWVESW